MPRTTQTTLDDLDVDFRHRFSLEEKSMSRIENELSRPVVHEVDRQRRKSSNLILNVSNIRRNDKYIE